MILTILQLTIPLLGFYSLHQIFSDKIEKKRVIKGLKLALGLQVVFVCYSLFFQALPVVLLPRQTANSRIGYNKPYPKIAKVCYEVMPSVHYFLFWQVQLPFGPVI